MLLGGCRVLGIKEFEMNSYFVRYVIDCEVKMIKFYLKDERDRFVKDFLLANQHDESMWIDLIFEGVVEWSEVGIDSSLSLECDIFECLDNEQECFNNKQECLDKSSDGDIK